MKTFILAGLIALLTLQACRQDNPPSGADLATAAAPPAANPSDDVIATVNGDVITRKDLEPVLMEGYGLNVLMGLVQLDLVEQEAAKMKLVVTPQDVSDERTITLQNLAHAAQEVQSNGTPTTQPDDLTPAEQAQLLDQVLQQQHVSKAEFDVVLQINAYLRRIAAPVIETHLTEEMIHQHFNTLYGEKIVVHYIVVNNMTEAGEVRRDLAAGKSFEDVARARSLDRRTAASGGELPAFSMQEPRLPDEFKQAAFRLKVGEVSDPVSHGNFIYLIKLIERVPPAQAKYQDYRDAVKKDLVDKTIQQAMAEERNKLAQMAMDSLHIKDPLLQEQWEQRITQRDGQLQDMHQIRQELDKEHTPATIPSVQMTPANNPTSAAAATMPATMPSAR